MATDLARLYTIVWRARGVATDLEGAKTQKELSAKVAALRFELDEALRWIEDQDGGVQVMQETNVSHLIRPLPDDY